MQLEDIIINLASPDLLEAPCDVNNPAFILGMCECGRLQTHLVYFCLQHVELYEQWCVLHRDVQVVEGLLRLAQKVVVLGNEVVGPQ